MTQFKILYLILLTTTLFACTSNQAQKKLLGKWTMVKVYDGENDVTNEHNPKNNRWIKFNRNGSFESDGDPHGYNSGDWQLNTEELILFLDSNVEGDDSEWKLAFDDNNVIWTGIGTQRQEQFKLILTKMD